MSKNKFLIIVGGATATGKTATGIQLAQHFETEILSCDSRQFYREMTIGKAKPTAEELAKVPHHFINLLSIEDNYNVGDFERDAIKVLDKIYLEKNIALLVGGSGLFIRALCNGLDKFPKIPIEVKNEVLNLFENEGLKALQEAVKIGDPIYYENVDRQNPVRLMRALDVIKFTGKPFSSFKNQQKKPRNFIPVYINVTMNREQLYDRINHRVDLMLEAGLLEEAKLLYPYKEKNSLQTVGYQEFMSYFEGKTTLEEAVELVKRNSRRYAKRQMTWFRKDHHWANFQANEIEKMIEYVQQEMT